MRRVAFAPALRAVPGAVSSLPRSSRCLCPPGPGRNTPGEHWAKVARLSGGRAWDERNGI